MARHSVDTAMYALAISMRNSATASRRYWIWPWADEPNGGVKVGGLLPYRLLHVVEQAKCNLLVAELRGVKAIKPGQIMPVGNFHVLQTRLHHHREVVEVPIAVVLLDAEKSGVVPLDHAVHRSSLSGAPECARALDPSEHVLNRAVDPNSGRVGERSQVEHCNKVNEQPRDFPLEQS